MADLTNINFETVSRTAADANKQGLEHRSQENKRLRLYKRNARKQMRNLHRALASQGARIECLQAQNREQLTKRLELEEKVRVLTEGLNATAACIWRSKMRTYFIAKGYLKLAKGV